MVRICNDSKVGKLMNQILDIATATSRSQVMWSNEQYSWEKFVRKLSITHRTAEPYTTYMSSPKPRQAEIKDIGGFVGGYLLEGHRKKGSVKYRQLLTLDIDYGYPDLWDDFTMFYPNAALVYSTHAHSIVAPRFRLLLPLDRPVTPEEYEAIGRKIAGIIGTHCFDRTTFQAERMMFWPSTARDGIYYFKSQEGPWLSADSVLAEYRDWRNVSEWPLCPTETEIIKSDLKRQEDPTEKEGIIGAFCRTYSIAEAIEEFLPGLYTPAGGERYTYSEGSTAAGAICYDDKFMYSHHSTDPISGQLVNAFDLVRIHKFGAEDKDPSAPIGKRPSFSLMNALARKDANVVREIGVFNLDLPEGSDTEWLTYLEVDKRGNYQPTIDNFLLILRNDPRLKGKFASNEFDYLLYIRGEVPWEKSKQFREISDEDEAGMRHYFETEYGMYQVNKVKDAFSLACQDNSFHPVREYLGALMWDGVPRLDSLFIDQLGVPDTKYTRAVTRKSLVAAVARVMEPGIKYDTMVVMIGAQGKGKSSLLRDLGKEWFSDTLDSLAGKEAYMQIQGVWILEMAELSGMKKADVEVVKKFLSAQKDRYRVPFAKHNTTFKRQTVPFGSTNETSFLKDQSGNRRFWPLVVTKKYQPGSIAPDQIWAEAVYRYERGETLYLSEELEALAAQQQMEHTEADERAGMIERFLSIKLPEDWAEMSVYERISYVSAYDEREGKGVVDRNRVCAAEIWCELLGNKFPEMTPYNTKFIHNILINMQGWKRVGSHSYKKYGTQRSYVRTGSVEDKVNSMEEEWALL